MNITLPAPSATIVEQLSVRTTFLTGSEIMALVGISRPVLCRWVRSGRLPGAFKLGKNYRFDPATIAAWIAARHM
jgi:excisionase family DNA binding protein